MSRRPLSPPRGPQWLIAWLLPAADHEWILGDLEERFAARVDAGATAAAARRAYWRDAVGALAAFGEDRVDRAAGRRRDRRQGDAMVKTLFRDARYGVRLLLRNPGFTLVAVLTLALGIGANTAIFTVTHAVLLKPLSYPEPEQLVIVNENNLSRGWTSFSVSPANFIDWRTSLGSFSSLAAYSSRAFNYSGGSAPERLQGLAGTAGFLEILGGTPVIGRGFHPEEFEFGRHFVVILGHGFWQRAFGGREDVLNQAILLNNQPYTIVGVMHADWRFGGGQQVATFTPYAWNTANNEAQARGAHYLGVIGRLKPGVTLAAAQSEASTLATRLDEEYPNTNKGWGIVTRSLMDAAVGGVRPMLSLLLGAVGVVLLVACANLANMHLARGTVRAREMAIRTAIGARRGRIVQQLLTESVVLAIIGGGLGLLLAYLATSAFLSAYPTLLPRSTEIGIDPIVFAFSAGVSVLTALLFGLAPAVVGARTDLVETLKASSRGSTGRRWLRSALVVSEMALAVVLLVGAGLLIKSFVRLAGIDPGFDPAGRFAARTILPGAKYSMPAQVTDFYDRAVERLRAVPGIEQVALTSVVPISGGDEIYSIEFEGRPPLPPGQGFSANYYLVSPDYFQTMGIPLLKGRAFSDQDRDGTTRVTVINDAFARLHYRDEDPIGKRIRMGRNSSIIREIVGVVGSVKHYALSDAADQAQMYEPFRQMPATSMTFVLRTGLEPAQVSAAVRREIQEIDRDQPILAVRRIEQMIADSSALPRVQMVLLGGFAGIALLIASVGLYGVMAYTVSQRTQEIGVRMALGAHRPAVLLMVLRQGLVLVAVGLVVGIAGALALGQTLATVLEPMLFQVTPADTSTLIAVPIVLAIVGLAASFLPARRATRVDPIQALRNT